MRRIIRKWYRSSALRLTSVRKQLYYREKHFRRMVRQYQREKNQQEIQKALHQVVKNITTRNFLLKVEMIIRDTLDETIGHKAIKEDIISLHELLPWLTQTKRFVEGMDVTLARLNDIFHGKRSKPCTICGGISNITVEGFSQKGVEELFVEILDRFPARGIEDLSHSGVPIDSELEDIDESNG